MKVLVTGGTGFIGSHACVELMAAGHECLIVDNLSNSKLSVLDAIAKITGSKPAFTEGDIRDGDLLAKLFAKYKPQAVMHFAGLKAVRESVEKPLEYYLNNVGGTAILLQAMQQAGCELFVFSSSSTVYGQPEKVPATEDLPVGAANPYGRTKLMIEEMLRDVAASRSAFGVALLRYFNPIGAHPSGLIGEDPNGIPNNLMPLINQVAAGKLARLQVTGFDYPTPDGTGVRDYIHVVDLARGHVKALEYLLSNPGVLTVNLGTGRGYSVLEIIKTYEKVNGLIIPYDLAPRRAGDIAENYANASRAKQLLGWQAELNLEDMCRDAWHFAGKQK